MPDDQNLKRVYKKRGMTDLFKSYGQHLMGDLAESLSPGMGRKMLNLGDRLARPKTTKREAKKSLRRNK